MSRDIQDPIIKLLPSLTTGSSIYSVEREETRQGRSILFGKGTSQDRIAFRQLDFFIPSRFDEPYILLRSATLHCFDSVLLCPAPDPFRRVR